MRPFLVCIHDASPAYDREIQLLVRGLAPLIGHRLSLGVVPDWHRAWPLRSHPDFCAFAKEASAEILLHGYVHQRQRGAGPATMLTGGSDEMNGLGPEETHHLLERGQRVLADAFGQRARGFVAPAWQRGRLRPRRGEENAPGGLDHVLGFFSLESWAGQRVPLATWTWDCGRWGWLGHVGHGFGRKLQAVDRRVPVLALHPADLARGFWPAILRATEGLLERGYQPSTVASLLDTTC